MAFLLTNLLQNIYSDLGQTPKNFGFFTATGGSATTFVNSAWGNLENPPETDSFKNMMAFVSRDAGGAGASPEGKWGLISGYVDSTYTGTIATVTDAIASGDTVMIAKQDIFPLEQVIFCVNRALQNMGDIPLPDTSLTSAAEEYYAVPVGLKRRPPYSVWYGSDADGWYPVSSFEFEPATAGSTGKIFIPNVPSGFTIKLIYDGVHPVVSSYSDPIYETIHPSVATTASILECLRWYNNTDENQGGNEFFTWREKEYEARLEMSLLKNPIIKPRRLTRKSIFHTPSKFPELDERNKGGDTFG